MISTKKILNIFEDNALSSSLIVSDRCIIILKSWMTLHKSENPKLWRFLAEFLMLHDSDF